MATLKIFGEDFELSTKLRVAYKLQEANNHKPYTKIFEDLGEMPLEKQIQFVWISFNIANPNMMSITTPGAIMKEQEFRDAVLDGETNLDDLLEAMKKIIDGIMYQGKTEEEIAQIKKEKASRQEAITPEA